MNYQHVRATAAGWGLLVVLIVCAPGHACERVSPRAHAIVATRAIELLPDPLGPLLQPSAAKIASLASEIPDRAAAHHTMRGDVHFMILDVAATGAPFEERRRAALAFPRDVRGAMALCERTGRTECGRIPWGMIETYAALAVAFRAGEDDRVATEAATLLHLATDAAMPFNTTIYSLADGDSGHVASDQNSLTSIFQRDLVERNRERLLFEVRPWPERFKTMNDPASAAFDALLEAHRDLEALVERGNQTEGTDERIIDLLEQRLEAGALLGAGLIHGAWTAAGKPAPDRSPAIQTTSEDSETDSTGTVCRAPYCGSRDSTIYHTASCAHVRRIKPENMVNFSSSEEATQAGRQPCRKCKPDLPNTPSR